MDKTIKIPGELESVAIEGIVADSKAIIDRKRNKRQEEVNDDIDAKIENQDNKIDALEKQDYVVVDALPDVVDADPKKIYRVAGTTSYTDHMLNAAGDEFKQLATYSFPGIDDEPTAGSENLVKSSGVDRRLIDVEKYNVGIHRRLNFPSNSIIIYSDIIIKAGESILIAVESEISESSRISAMVRIGTENFGIKYITNNDYVTLTNNQESDGVLRFYNMTPDTRIYDITILGPRNIADLYNLISELNESKSSVSIESNVQSQMTKITVDGANTIISAFAGINRNLFSVDGKLITKQGSDVSNAGFISTQPIEVLDGDIDIFCYDGGSSLPNYGLVFYDENKTKLGRYETGESTYDNRYIHVSRADFPEGTKYFAASIGKTVVGKAFILYNIDKLLGEYYPEIAQFYKEYNQNLAEIANLGIIENIQIPNKTDNKTINTRTGAYATAVSSYPDCEASNAYIPVKPGKTYLLTGKVTAYYGVAGFDENKSYKCAFWSLQVGVVSRVESGTDIEMVIPDGVYYLKLSTIDKTNYPISIKEKKTVSDLIQESYSKSNYAYGKIKAPIIVKITSATTLEIWSLNHSTGKYIIHPFGYYTYSYDMSQYGGSSNVICEDGWDPLDILTESGERIIQPNLNFIYKVEPNAGFENEDLHVGTVGGGHGCEVREFTKIIVDGNDLDLDNLVAGTEIECSTVQFIQKSKCLAPDKSISSSNVHNYPKIVNGEPVVTAIHYVNAVYYPDNVIRWRNRLIIQRDNVKFSQLHGGMLRSWTPKLNYLIANNADCSMVHWGTRDGQPFIEGVGSTFTFNGAKRKGDEVTMYGDGIVVRQRMIQDDGTRYNKNWLFGTFYTATSNKIYFMPADVSVAGGSAETFNTGDIISVTNERKIECNF